MRAAVRRKSLPAEKDAAAVHRLLDGAGREGDDRDLHVEGLEQGDAEAFVGAEAQITAGQPVIGHELVELHVPGDMDVRKRQPRDEVLERGPIALDAAVVARPG